MSEVTLEWMQKNPLATIGYIVELEGGGKCLNCAAADRIAKLEAATQSVDMLKVFVDKVMPQLTGKDQREARELLKMKGGFHMDD
jgi:hypothetical protein